MVNMINIKPAEYQCAGIDNVSTSLACSSKYHWAWVHPVRAASMVS